MFNEFFVRGMACLGAGIAMIAGLGPGIGQVLQLVKVQKVLVVTQMQQVKFNQSWYLVSP